MAQNRHTIYCIRQSRYGGERVMPDQKIEGVTDDEMPGLMSSNRFVTEERWKEIQAAKKTAEKPAK